MTREETLRARELRADASIVERIMREKLRKNRVGFRFRFQHAYRGVIFDFYCPEARLAVEFDGEQHDAGKDALRDARIATFGIETMRIPNRQFFMLDEHDEDRYVDWIERIIERCETRTGRHVER